MSFNVNVFSPFVYIDEENGQNVAKNFAFFLFSVDLQYFEKC